MDNLTVFSVVSDLNSINNGTMHEGGEGQLWLSLKKAHWLKNKLNDWRPSTRSDSDDELIQQLAYSVLQRYAEMQWDTTWDNLPISVGSDGEGLW